MSGELQFSFFHYAKALTTVIEDSEFKGSFVVGVTGPWGSGKTTLLNTVLDNLDDKKFLRVAFNAWAHSKQDAVSRALFISVVEAVRKDLDVQSPKKDGQERGEEGSKIESLLDDAEKALYTAFTRETPGEMQLDFGQLAKAGAKLALRFIPWGDLGSTLLSWFALRSPELKDTLAPVAALGDGSGKQEGEKEEKAPDIKEKDVDKLWGILKRNVVRQHIAQVKSMEQFRRSMDTILKTALKDRRLVVLVDDVDRCLPEQGLEVFEAIKLYLDLPGSVFLVAMDQEVLQHALDLRYHQKPGTARRVTAEVYAEKMIDLTFGIPAYEEEAFRSYVKTLPVNDVLDRHYSLICSALTRNPRTWQRFAHRAFLHLKIFDALWKQRSSLWKMKDVEAAFVKLQLLSFRWPALYRALGSMEHLSMLEQCLRGAGPQIKARASKSSLPGALREHVADAAKLPDTIWPEFEDLGLIPFLLHEPNLSKPDEATFNLLKKIFAIDLPQPSTPPEPVPAQASLPEPAPPTESAEAPPSTGEPKPAEG